MTLYEVYGDAVCPRCGCTESRDRGPYEYLPGIDDALGGPPDPVVHEMQCLGCGKPFDVAPDAHAKRVVAAWPRGARGQVYAEWAGEDAIRAAAEAAGNGR